MKEQLKDEANQKVREQLAMKLNEELKKETIILAYKEWKMDCYGILNASRLYNPLGVDTLSFTKQGYSTWSTATYPNLKDEPEFHRNLEEYKSEAYSFSFVANIFSKLLFSFLHQHFREKLATCQENSSISSSEAKYYLAPFLKITQLNEERKHSVSFVNDNELFDLDSTAKMK